MIQINLTEEELVSGDKCLELEIPWMVTEAIYKLDEVLNGEDIILEIGSGGSTLFFSNRSKFMATVETDNEWGQMVMERYKNKLMTGKCVFGVINSEDEICKYITNENLSEVTVFCVDTQGGYNRSRILNTFLEKGVSPNLRIIILDNYAHQELFPDHYDKDNFMGEEWEVFTYNHERWAGNGTRIYLKKSDG